MRKKTRALNGKVQVIFIGLILISLFSCTKKETNEEPKPTVPVIGLISPTGPQLNVEPYEKVSLSLNISAAGGSSEMLSGFKFTKQFELEAIEVVMDTVLNGSLFQLSNFDQRVSNQIGTEVWTFEATDSSGDITVSTLTFSIDGAIVNLAPSIILKSGLHQGTGWTYVNGDTTVQLSSHFVFGFTASSESDINLSHIEIIRNYENVSALIVLDSTLDAASFSRDIKAVAYPTPGDELFTITVTDLNELSTSVSFTITTVADEPDIHSYSNINLGSFTSNVPAGFASSTGETFSLSDLNDPASRKKIDFVYFHGSSYGHTIAAPAADIAAQVYSTTIATWANEERNITLFGLTNISPAMYNSIESKAQIILDIQNDGVALDEQFQSEFLSNPPGFAVNDIVAFETHDGNRGLIKITAVNPGATNGESTITFDLKVEKPSN